MIRHITLLFTIVFIFCLTTVKGQEYLSDLSTFTPKDGLSSRFIRWIHEDSKGFIWLATDNGLNRFDGHDFKVFNTENSNLFSNYCNQIFEDVDGNIWVGFQTTGSITKATWHSVVTPTLDIVNLDDFFKDKLPIPAKEIRTIHEAPNKRLILITNHGVVYKYDGVFTKIAQDERLKNTLHLHLDSTEKLYYFLPEELLISQLGEETESIKRPTNQSIPMLKDSKLYWYNYNKLKNSPSTCQLYSATDSIDFFPKNFPVDSILFDNYIISNPKFFLKYFTHESFLKLYQSGTGVVNIVDKKLSKDYVNVNHENGLFTRKNKYWFWNENGINLLTFKTNPFQNIFKGEKHGSRAIYKLEANKFIFAPRIFNYDLETGRYRKMKTIEIPGAKGIVELKKDKYLFGVHSNKLSSYDFKNETYKAYELVNSDRTNFEGKNFLVPFKNNSGDIWIGTDQGIVFFNQEIDSLEVFKKYNEFGKLAKEKVTWFKEFSDGIWGACSKGIFVLNPKKGITNWHHPLPDLRVEHFLREDSIFWLATYGNGLVKWNHITNEVKSYRLKHGLLDENLMAVYPDSRNNLWVTTNWGLARFDRTTETFKVFLESDGINHNEFNIASHFQDEDGKLFFGGLDGITIFDPNNFPKIERDSLSNLMLTGYEEIDSKTLESKDKTTEFLKKKSIEISPDIKTFIVKFALLNYENIDNTRYAYKVENLDKEWNFQKENYIKFNRLPPGEYTVRIKALDYQGNEYNELSIPLRVAAPFYKKPLWQIIGFLLFGGILFGIFKQKQYATQKEKETLERLVNERTSELQSLNETKDRLFAILAHDLRNPVIAFEELAETINYLMQKNEPEQISKLGNQIELEAKQLHHLLDNLLSWALTQRDDLPIDFSNFNLKKFLKEVEITFKQLAKKSGVLLSIDESANYQLTTDRRILEIVTRNVITNAFRYSEKGDQIKIFILKEKEQISINFQDTGIGMTPDELKHLFDVKRKFREKGTTSTVSLGMHLCKELIELLGGKISAETKIGAGTLVTIKLPIRPKST